jgi:hypothetical protein
MIRYFGGVEGERAFLRKGRTARMFKAPEVSERRHEEVMLLTNVAAIGGALAIGAKRLSTPHSAQ